MKNIEIKSFVIGFLLAVVLLMVSGNAGNNDCTSNSFAVSAPSGGFLLVKDRSGSAFIINEKGENKGIVRSSVSNFDLAE